MLTVKKSVEIKSLGRLVLPLTIIQTVKSGFRQFNRPLKTKYYRLPGYVGVRKNQLFCFPCVLFLGQYLWIKFGIRDSNRLAEIIRKYQVPSALTNNTLQLAFWYCQCRRNVIFTIENVLNIG